MLSKLREWFLRYRDYRRLAALGERAVVINTDDNGISATYSDGQVAAIRWSEVDTVAIVTNDSGPWGYDVHWLLEGNATRCIYPNGATGSENALEQLEKRFPGFSDEMVIKAMGSTSNKRFVCWERSNAP